MERKPYEYYTGLGRRGDIPPLPPSPAVDESPWLYFPSPGLRSAVNVALMLGQPLLLTGEPGTGKTTLADSVAYELGMPKLEFHTKTTSTASDLFYRYDALGHFHDAQFVENPPPVESYITFEPLGQAIVLSLSPDDDRRRGVEPYLPEALRGEGPTRCVVLIDEIDKAPRDLPNDVLNEILSMSFEARELKRRFKADQGNRPFIIMTSNSEKNLPEPFLRRCVFHHIDFPDDATLMNILKARLDLDDNFTSGLRVAVEHFGELRGAAVKKKPATAELLWWVKTLRTVGLLGRLGAGLGGLSPVEVTELGRTYSVLAKTKEDFEAMMGLLSTGAALPHGQ